MGHGDSILLRTPNNKYGVIDCKAYLKNVPVIEHIRNNEIRELEFICLTHPHKDHYDGILKLIEFCFANGIKINKYYDSGMSPLEMANFKFERAEHAYTKLMTTIMDSSAKGAFAFEDGTCGRILHNEPDVKVISLGPDVQTIRRIQGLAARNQYPESTLNQYFNRYSIVLLVEVYNYKLLLLADAETIDQKAIHNKHKKALRNNVQVFKLSHHGSNRNYDGQLIKDFKDSDSTGVISAGCKYRMPSSEVINAVIAESVSLYLTNSFDYQNILTPSLGAGNPTVELELLNRTAPVNEYAALKPYHGDVTITISNTNIMTGTTTSKASL